MAFTRFLRTTVELFKAQRPKTAADEIIRSRASPITAFQRTALADTDNPRYADEEGERLVLFYRSANCSMEDDRRSVQLRYPAKPNGSRIRRHRWPLLRRRQPLEDDRRPDVQRDRLTMHPDLTPVAAPERLRSSMINGIKHWQVDYTGSTSRAASLAREANCIESPWLLATLSLMLSRCARWAADYRGVRRTTRSSMRVTRRCSTTSHSAPATVPSTAISTVVASHS